MRSEMCRANSLPLFPDGPQRLAPTVRIVPRPRLSYPRGSLSIAGVGDSQRMQNGTLEGPSMTVEGDT
jgi:hypothetical protein